MGITPFQQDCADAYASAKLVADELGISLFELPSLSDHLDEDGDLATWIDQHPQLPRGSEARHKVSHALVESFERSGWGFEDDGDTWPD